MADPPPQLRELAAIAGVMLGFILLPWWAVPLAYLAGNALASVGLNVLRSYVRLVSLPGIVVAAAVDVTLVVWTL